MMPLSNITLKTMADPQNNGRPSKPIRLMVGLLLLKQLENLSDERVVLQFKRNLITNTSVVTQTMALVKNKWAKTH